MKSWINLVFAVALVSFSVFMFVRVDVMHGILPLIPAIGLAVLTFNNTRRANILFGHLLIVFGSALVAWGVYLPAPDSLLLAIVFRPLFWGLISIFGGVCAIFHGFCSCVRACAAAAEKP